MKEMKRNISSMSAKVGKNFTVVVDMRSQKIRIGLFHTLHISTYIYSVCAYAVGSSYFPGAITFPETVSIPAAPLSDKSRDADSCVFYTHVDASGESKSIQVDSNLCMTAGLLIMVYK